MKRGCYVTVQSSITQQFKTGNEKERQLQFPLQGGFREAECNYLKWNLARKLDLVFSEPEVLNSSPAENLQSCVVKVSGLADTGGSFKLPSCVACTVPVV